MDYTAPNIGREFGTVYLGDKNVAYSVVSAGWARVMASLLSFFTFHFLYHIECVADFFFYFFTQVKEQGPKGGEQSPYLAELLRLEEVAKQQGLGRWSKVSSFFSSDQLFLLHEMNTFLDILLYTSSLLTFRNLVLLKNQ